VWRITDFRRISNSPHTCAMVDWPSFGASPAQLGQHLIQRMSLDSLVSGCYKLRLGQRVKI
jgi:hypothetical protein